MRIPAVVGALAVLGLAVVGSANAVSAAPPSKYGIVDVKKIKGTGCTGTARAALLTDPGTEEPSAMTVIYDAYTVELTSPEPSATLDCQIRIKIKSPKDRQYRIDGVTQRGFADIADGVVGKFEGSYAHPGRPSVNQPAYVLTGPVSMATWQDTRPTATTVSECGDNKQLVLDTRITVAARPDGKPQAGLRSYMSLDTTDAGFVTKFKLSWQPCNKHAR